MPGQVPPSGGSLEIGNIRIGGPTEAIEYGSPFGGIPRNWKHCIFEEPKLSLSEFPLRGDP
jgi:hypothetical protein